MGPLVWCWLIATSSTSVAVDHPLVAGPGAVTVRLAPPHSWLERRPDPSQPKFEPICQAPCDRSVPAGPGYRVAGPNFAVSPTFPLLQDSDIEVEFPNRDRAFAGGWISIGGGGLVLWGAGFLLGAALSVGEERDSFLLLSGVTGGVGLALLSLGVFLLSDVDGSVRINGEVLSD